MASWSPPPLGSAKINVSGIVSRLFHGGVVAAICRDHTGLYLGSSTVVFRGSNDTAIWESYAFREAISLAEDLDEHNICVASACREVVIDIARGIGGPNAAILQEIKYRCEDRHVWPGSCHDTNIVLARAMNE
ncbi:hypothetical protein D1007_07088 [Hordeum vulgare]|nr:hypothetical protein D1007_07088 [Hordeum vulgare]